MFVELQLITFRKPDVLYLPMWKHPTPKWWLPIGGFPSAPWLLGQRRSFPIDPWPPPQGVSVATFTQPIKTVFSGLSPPISVSSSPTVSRWVLFPQDLTQRLVYYKHSFKYTLSDTNPKWNSNWGIKEWLLVFRSRVWGGEGLFLTYKWNGKASKKPKRLIHTDLKNSTISWTSQVLNKYLMKIQKETMLSNCNLECLQEPGSAVSLQSGHSCPIK